MDLYGFFTAIGGDYDETMGRLMKEERICKYLVKFTDASDYANMMQAIGEEKWPDAFRFAHNLKGTGLNLGLGPMARTASELCETMRHGAPECDIRPLMEKLEKEYAVVIENIGILKESLGS